MQGQEANPRLSSVVRLVMIVVALVVTVGASLLFIPSLVAPWWPWALTPFTVRFLGAIYLSELVGALMYVIVHRWSPGRITLAEAVTFTSVVTVVSFLHLDQFDFARARSWG